MNKKAYIDWLNEKIESTKGCIDYYVSNEEFAMEDDRKELARLRVSLVVYRDCLNHIKGR